jgi:hypothetical protein
MIINFLGHKTIRFIYTFLLCSAVLSIGWGFSIARSSRAKAPYSSSVSGTLQKAFPTGFQRYRVEVFYELHSGTELRVTTDYRSESVPAIGEKVLVRYNPHEPSDLILFPSPPVNPELLFFLALILGGLGFRFFIMFTFYNAKVALLREKGKRITPSMMELTRQEFRLFFIIKVAAIRIDCRWSAVPGAKELLFYSEFFPTHSLAVSC